MIKRLWKDILVTTLIQMQKTISFVACAETGEKRVIELSLYNPL